MALIETIVWDVLWGLPLIILSLAVGIFFTFATGFFQFRHFGYAMKQAYKKFFKSNNQNEDSGSISPFEALSIAIGATVGVGNIGGVASAIALGGPGAIFWLWVAGVLGQIIKVVEVSLAVHYRSRDEKGNTFGGPTYYMRKGLGKEKNLKVLSKILAFIFIFGFGVGFFITMQNYTVSEAVSSTFDLSMVTVSIVYTVLLYLMISGGLPSLGKIASKIVPFMCAFYILGGIFIILKNFSQIPGTLGLIFGSAFSGTAAFGGFAGAAFSQVIKVGMSRAVFSNEAGWGSSPMIHASAKSDHPVRQGLLGIFEVFMDTIVICSITSLVIVITGEWSSGVSGAALTLSAFEHGLGSLGRIILTIGILLFGVTTSSGLYAQIEVLLRYVLGDNNKNKDKILTFYKWAYPIPGLALVVIAVVNELPGVSVWLFADMSTALPIFANMLTLLILSPKFLSLLKDYKARHMGIGEVDPNFKVFYEEKEEASSK